MNFIYFISGLILGAVIIWIYYSNKNKDTVDIKNVLSPLETKLNEFTAAFQSAYRDEANQKVRKDKLKLLVLLTKNFQMRPRISECLKRR